MYSTGLFIMDFFPKKIDSIHMIIFQIFFFFNTLIQKYALNIEKDLSAIFSARVNNNSSERLEGPTHSRDCFFVYEAMFPKLYYQHVFLKLHRKLFSYIKQ